MLSVAGVVIWAGDGLKLTWIGLVNMSNRTSRTVVELFETFRSYSCVNTQVFIHDTEKLPFLAISLYREWISLCRDWKHLKMFCICVQLRNAKNGNLGHESTDKRFCVLICIQLRIGLTSYNFSLHPEFQLDHPASEISNPPSETTDTTYITTSTQTQLTTFFHPSIRWTWY